MEQQLIKVRLETRKWGKPNTVIEGFDVKTVNLSELATKLKSSCACGGTAKNNIILLQGDHREKVKQLLVQQGFPEKIIEVH
jgi:translation initiation factor 1